MGIQTITIWEGCLYQSEYLYQPDEEKRVISTTAMGKLFEMRYQRAKNVASKFTWTETFLSSGDRKWLTSHIKQEWRRRYFAFRRTSGNTLYTSPANLEVCYSDAYRGRAQLRS